MILVGWANEGIQPQLIVGGQICKMDKRSLEAFMNPQIIRDPDQARLFVLQGLWFQRTQPLKPAIVSKVLQWAYVILDGGQPLPPLGFLADLGNAALGRDRSRGRLDLRSVPGWAAGSVRAYEDHVIGKFVTDLSFERAGHALKRIEPAKQALALSYVIKQFRERGGVGGVEFSPGILRGLMEHDQKPEGLLNQGWESLQEAGPLPVLLSLYDQITTAARRLPELLAPEDVIALEQRTALLSMGEYVAHRQIVQIAARFAEALPRQHIRPLGRKQEVPTRLLDDDAYPVGGFSSISTRGGIESLLHSQLAYMENDRSLRPDLFDIKYLRDELYYYSRDENQFLRRRRGFLFVLMPNLVLARFKDPELPAQRLVLALALLLAGVRKLSEWLSTESLHFEFLLPQGEGDAPLAEEGRLLQLLFREMIENGTVKVEHLSFAKLNDRVQEQAKRSLWHGLVVSAGSDRGTFSAANLHELRLDAERPQLLPINRANRERDVDEPFDDWVGALVRLLGHWGD